MVRRIALSALLAGFAVVLGSLALTGFGDSASAGEKKSETIHLFNGKNLDGWEGYMDHFSVQDGVIVAKNDKPVKTSTYLLTKRKFRDFRLTFSGKLVKSKMHSGVAIWGRKFPEADNAKDPKAARTEYTYQGHLVMFPEPWGMYDLYRRHGKILLKPHQEASRKVGKPTDWNDHEILAIGNRLRVVLNGTLVFDYTEPESKLIMEGPIGLQLHSNSVPQEVHFKGLVLTTNPEDKLTTVK